MQDEMIPLSANIFHARGDDLSRIVASLDIAIHTANLSMMKNNNTDDLGRVLLYVEDHVARAKKAILERLPASYDCRGDLGTALDGRDTAAPKEATDAEK